MEHDNFHVCARSVCANNLQNLQQMVEQTAASSGALDALSLEWQQELFLFAVLVFMSSIWHGRSCERLQLKSERPRLSLKSLCLMFTLQSQEQQCTSMENAVAWTVRIRCKSCVHLDVQFAFPDGYVYIEKEVYPDDWMWFLDESPLQCSSSTLCRARHSRRLVVDDQE